MIKTTLVSISLLFALSACTQLPGINKQGYAGINTALVELKDGMPTRVEIVGGKEQQDISMTFETPNGLKATYTANDVKAFKGQALRAEVEKVLTEAQKTAGLSAGLVRVTPGLVTALTAILKR